MMPLSLIRIEVKDILTNTSSPSKHLQPQRNSNYSFNSENRRLLGCLYNLRLKS